MKQSLRHNGWLKPEGKTMIQGHHVKTHDSHTDCGVAQKAMTEGKKKENQ